MSAVVLLGRRWRRLPVVVWAAGVLTLGVGVGAAYGYFTSDGSHTGSATIGKLTEVQLIPTSATPSTLLYAGGSADVRFAVDNTNNYSVTIVSVTSSTGSTISAAGGRGACSGAGGATFVGYTGTPISVPAHTSGGASYAVTLATAASMSASSTTGCQTATFSIPVEITVVKG